MNDKKDNISRWSRLSGEMRQSQNQTPPSFEKTNTKIHENHTCCDDLEEENITDTFGPMSAFNRARWLKSKEGNPMEPKIHRVRISGETTNIYEQVIELSDEELQKFRDNLKDQGIDDLLGKEFSNKDPIDWRHGEWSAELIDDNNSVIELLDID